MVIRLAHYSGRYLDAIKFYNDFVSGTTTNSVLQPLSLALRGGALFRTDKTKEAAYVFSEAFSASTEFAGTAYLREYNYANAIEWFKKSPDKKSLLIHKNPFIDLLYDQEEQLAKELKFSTSKLAFAESMLLLMKQAETDKNVKARYMFMMAKCSQKKIPKPVYSDYFNYNWDHLDAAEKLYWLRFKRNRHFPQLVKDNANTVFYREA